MKAWATAALEAEKDKRDKGFNRNLQIARRAFRAKGAPHTLQERNEALARELVDELTKIDESWMLVAKFPLAPFSVKALKRWDVHQKRAAQEVPNCKRLLKSVGLLDMPEYHRGRKAPASTKEEPIAEEEVSTRNWAEFWLQLGGFENPDDRDENNWLPLHHSLDSMTFSRRAALASVALIPLTEDINKHR